MGIKAGTLKAVKPLIAKGLALIGVVLFWFFFNKPKATSEARRRRVAQ